MKWYLEKNLHEYLEYVKLYFYYTAYFQSIKTELSYW